MKESQHEEPNDEGFHKFSKGPAIKKKTDVSDYVPILKFCMKKTPQTACLKKQQQQQHRILMLLVAVQTGTQFSLEHSWAVSYKDKYTCNMTWPFYSLVFTQEKLRYVYTMTCT